MRAVLLFPPLASPTYVPLGVAALAAHVRSAVPDARLRTLDLNVETWRAWASRDPRGAAVAKYCRSARDTFFDQAGYRRLQTDLVGLRGLLAQLSSDAARYVETNEAPPAVEQWTTAQVDRVLRHDPALVGISVVFLEQLPFALAIAKAIAAAAPAPRTAYASGRPRIVLGGAAMSALREREILRACPYVDAIVIGEGEAAWEALCRHAPLAQVPSLVWRDAGGCRHNAPGRILSLRCALPPDFSDLPLASYFNPEPVLPIVYSRGCVWRRCRFCAHNLSFSSYRRKRVDAFIDELAELSARHGADHFYLADQYVGAGDLEQLAWGLLDRGLRIRFHVMGRPVGSWTARRLETLARAGCCWISWGIESGSQRLLDACDKGTRVPVVEEIIRHGAQAGISNLLMLIFGLPTSTDQDLDLTLSFLGRLEGSFEAITMSRFTLFERTFFGRNPERFDLRVVGPEVLLNIQGSPIHSRRLTFRETSADRSLRPPRGPLEIAAARRRVRWLSEVSFLSDMACEHYLLYAGGRWSGSGCPTAAGLPAVDDPSAQRGPAPRDASRIAALDSLPGCRPSTPPRTA